MYREITLKDLDVLYAMLVRADCCLYLMYALVDEQLLPQGDFPPMILRECAYFLLDSQMTTLHLLKEKLNSLEQGGSSSCTGMGES